MGKNNREQKASKYGKYVKAAYYAGQHFLRLAAWMAKGNY